MTKDEELKPLGHKAYGSIPHLPESRIGIGEHKCSEGQAIIATKKWRDRHDLIIVQEKLDGSNCSIAKVNGQILALGRAGYLAESSPYRQHLLFSEWVKLNIKRFEFLRNDERLCGEWLIQAHGTRYELPHEPFVAFDLMIGHTRFAYHAFLLRVLPYGFTIPRLINMGYSFSLSDAINAIDISGHGAIDEVEGVVYRVERRGAVDFLVKYVRPNKIDGKYLEQNNNGEPVWNVMKN